MNSKRIIAASLALLGGVAQAQTNVQIYGLLNSGILLDTGASDQNGLLLGRHAYVGLRQKGLGTVTLGRQYTPIYHTLIMIDPSANNYGGAAGQLMAGEVAGNGAASRSTGGSLTYVRGNVTARVAYNKTNDATAHATRWRS